MTYQLILFLVDGYGYGWSEVYWMFSSDPTLLLPYITSLIGIRNSILSNDCATVSYRLSTGNYRAPIIGNANPSGSGAPTGQVAGPAAADFARLILRWMAPKAVGRTFLGGIPQAYVVGDNFLPSVNYYKALNAFIGYISGGVFNMRSTIFNGKPARVNATTFLPYMPKGFSFQAGTGTVPQGSIIRVHQCLVPGYNGTKTVVKVVSGSGSDTIVVGGGMPAAADPGTNNPFVTLENPVFVTITSGIWENITHRPAGRPVGQRRGRRASTVPLRR